MDELRRKIKRLIPLLSAGLIERELGVRLALLAALAGEHLLLIGPPGTAKSELARRLHKAFDEAAYFERLLTRFSVPEELFGPLSIAALEQDRYERQVEGYLPAASIAFIDEVFKANSAILNALLTLLNEREFDNGSRRIACPLISVIGASNEVPEDDVIAAFYDRFLLRLPVPPVGREAFAGLLQGEDVEVGVADALRLGAADRERISRSAGGVAISLPALELLQDLRDHLAAEGTVVSDRRWRRIAGLLRVAAATCGRRDVSIWDCWLVAYCATQRPEQCAAVGEWYARRLGVFAALDPVRFRRVVEGFEAQLELEQGATDLNYGADGRLAMFGEVSDTKHGDQAPRLLLHSRRRRYGKHHVAARTGQVAELIDEVDDYLLRLDGRLGEMEREAADHLWIAPGFLPEARTTLLATRDTVLALRWRLEAVAAGFRELPRHEQEDDPQEPEPMAVA